MSKRISCLTLLLLILWLHSIPKVHNYPFNPIYHKCALDLEHEKSAITVKQEYVKIRRKKRTLTHLQIYPYYDDSFNFQRHSFLYKTYIIQPAVEYLQSALYVRNRYPNIKLQRKCITNRLAFVKINEEFSYYCVDGCATKTTCGDIEIPPEHLMACRRLLNSQLVKVGSEGVGVNNTDFILYIESRQSRKCDDPSVLAYASSCQSESQLDRPIAGSINFCPGRLSSDFGHLSQSLFIAKHELIHALGFAITQFAFYRDSNGVPYTPRSSLTGRPDLGFLHDRSNIYLWSNRVTRSTIRRWQSAVGFFLKNVTLLVLPTVVREARKYFNCSSLTGMELEDQGGLGVAITHWEKRILENDIMTATFTQEARVSRITLALMYDTGWYIPNYALADDISWGKHLGCDFLEMGCYEYIQNRNMKGQSIEPFCAVINRPDEELSGFCSADRHAYAYCNIEKHQHQLEPQYRYFTEDQIYQSAYYGGKSTVANYCPYPQEFNWYKGDYVSRTTQCAEERNNQNSQNNFLLQEFGPKSSCFALSKKWQVDACGKKIIPSVIGAGCYKFSCSHLFGLLITVHNQTYQCPRQYEDAFKEERRMRSFIENHWKQSQEQIKELESRLRSTEDLVNQERYQIRDLVNQSKTVEELMFSTKKDSSLLNDRQISKLTQLEREMEILNDNRNKLERISFQLVDEMKVIKTKLESQGFDFTAITHELRNKSKKLEDEYQQNIDVVKKQLSRNENTLSDSMYRPIIDQKLIEMKDYISQIRTWHDDEVNERRVLEKTIMSKFSEISHAMSEQTRNRDEAIRQIQYLQREKDHKIETERMIMQNKISEITEQINSKVLEKDLRLREEQLKRQSELEKLLRSEQETRISYEREIRLENERRLDGIRQLQLEELNNIKDSLKYDKTKYVESIKRLDESLSLLERQIDENKHEITKIITAEVKARGNNEKVFKERFTELEEKIIAATSSLQQALSGVADKSLPNNDKIRKLTNDTIDEYKASISRQIADLDARILHLQTLSSRGSVDIDEKIKEAITSVNNTLKEKVETISLNQGTTNASIAQLKIQKQQLKQEIYELNETVMLAKAESNGRITAELNSRIETEEALRFELEKLRESIPKEIVSKSDLEKVKATARKLAESMQTIKTVLGMKIQSEQNLRIEEIKNHQEELIQLKSLIEPLIIKASARANEDQQKPEPEPDTSEDPTNLPDADDDDKIDIPPNNDNSNEDTPKNVNEPNKNNENKPAENKNQS